TGPSGPGTTGASLWDCGALRGPAAGGRPRPPCCIRAAAWCMRRRWRGGRGCPRWHIVRGAAAGAGGSRERWWPTSGAGAAGGDLVHAAALARRLRVPALAYLERGSRWSRRFAEVLVPDERARRSVLRRGEADQRIAVVGDLMVDAVRGGAGRRRLAAEWGLDPEKPIVALFPGSRPYEIRLTIRFFLRAMELLRADHPDAQCVISLSAYGTPDLLRGSDEDALEGTS